MRASRASTSARRKAHPGVIAVYTGADMTGVNSLPCGLGPPQGQNIPGVLQDLTMVPHMPLTSTSRGTSAIRRGW
jgi:hypothetical protein